LHRLYGVEEWLGSDIYQLGSEVEIASFVGAFKLSLIGAYGIAIGGYIIIIIFRLKKN
jgi:uncharacterized protein (DUF2062 family)